MSVLNDPRVFLAAERTLLAWTRTALSLIAFGFVMERAGMLVALLVPQAESALSPVFTLWLGLLFILLGALVALLSTLQHRTVLRTLNEDEVPTGYGTDWAMFVNLAVAFLGALLAVWLMLTML
jgi:putative membrane protein